MTIDEIKELLGSKRCNWGRGPRECKHPGCEAIDAALSGLNQMVRFKGRDEKGKPVCGWLLPDEAES